MACEKNATIPLPKSERKMVLSCFLSPDEDDINVTLTWSKPIFGQNPNGGSQQIENAQVEITGPYGTAFLAFNSDLEYQIDQKTFPLFPGETYTITAKEPGGKVVKGTCTIPGISTSSLSVTTVDSILLFADGMGNDTYRYLFKASFIADQTEASWYRLGAYMKTSESNPDDPLKDEYWMPLDYELESRFFVSERANPTPFSVTLGTAGGYYGAPDSEEVYQFELIKGDKNYYKFHESLFNFDGENPFAEPTRLYSNVEGGLGVVCSYLKESKIVIK
jgi:hypothetical protein